MASTQVIEGGDGRPAAIYSVDLPVGPHGANRLTDVLLVQFFIHRISRHRGRQIEITGHCDEATVRAIREMQAGAHHRGHRIRVDGSVDPIRGVTGFASLSHTVYTIIWFNEAYRHYHQLFYNDIRRDPLLPNILRQSLTPANAIAGNVLVGME